MTLQKLASEIAKREGKKSQARIGDIREIVGILADVFFEDGTIDIYHTLFELGAKRAKRRKKK